MKITQNQIIPGLEDEMRRRFSNYKKMHPVAKSRRFAPDLIELVRRAATQGMKKGVLCQITGVSSSTMHRWLNGRKLENIQPRRLEVVRDEEVVVQPNSPVLKAKICPSIAAIVRLPSGITVELADSRALVGDLLFALSTMEVRHASSS